MTASDPEEVSLVFQKLVRYVDAFALLVLDPFGERPIEIWVFAFRFAERGPAAVGFLEEIFVLVAKDFRDSAFGLVRVFLQIT